MFDVRDLRILIALARHRHFGRAAEACGITQPAFSMRIRAMEERTGAAIVRRGNRFQGLTPEGEVIVDRARDILDAIRSLEEEVRSSSGRVSGTLSLGAVPTAAASAARLAGQLHRMFPDVIARIETASSLTIQTRIEEGTLDAGITYGDSVAGDVLRVAALYQERYELLAPCALVPEGAQQITWAEAAALPLALLEPGMQNRRILDDTFRRAGAEPRVISETNALTTTLVMAREGLAATVLPRSLIDTLGTLEGTVSLPLVEPEIEKTISLVSAQGPDLPTVRALWHAAGTMYDQDI